MAKAMAAPTPRANAFMSSLLWVNPQFVQNQTNYESIEWLDLPGRSQQFSNTLCQVLDTPFLDVEILGLLVHQILELG
jgi:hypothetical protein